MYETEAGGAAGGEDFNSIANKDIAIPTTATVITETISITDDGILEFDETFSVTVTSRSEPHLITAAPASTIVTIDDNDGNFHTYKHKVFP